MNYPNFKLDLLILSVLLYIRYVNKLNEMYNHLEMRIFLSKCYQNQKSPTWKAIRGILVSPK